MKRELLVLGAMLALTSIGHGQSNGNANASANADSSVNAANKVLANTSVSGVLQSELNAEKAKVGDQVLLKTTKDIKQNGKVVVNKGSVIAGRVTEVTKKAKGNNVSRIGVVFDEIKQKGQSVPINAMITSIVGVSSNASLGSDDTFMASSSASSRTSANSSTSSGGLLGGVSNTVGGVTGTATNAVGAVANTTTQTVGSAVNTTAGAVRGLQISNSTSASANGSSMLSVDGRNLKLEKGTTFNLAVSNSTSVDGNR